MTLFSLSALLIVLAEGKVYRGRLATRSGPNFAPARSADLRSPGPERVASLPQLTFPSARTIDVPLSGPAGLDWCVLPRDLF